MKTIIKYYSFDKTFGYLTFKTNSAGIFSYGIDINAIYYIKNVTRGVELYKAGQDPSALYVAGEFNDAVALPGDYSAWDNSDKFLIIYECAPFFVDLLDNTDIQVIRSLRRSSSYESNNTGSSIGGGNTTNYTLWYRDIESTHINKLRIHLIGGSGNIRFYTVNDPLSAAWGYDLEWVLIHTNETKVGTGSFPAPSGGNSIVIEVDVSAISNVKIDVSDFSGSTLSYGVVESTQKRAKGSHSRHRALSAGSINATIVKGSPARLFMVHVYNNAAAAKFLKLYNKTTAPAPATDTSLLIMKIPIAPNSAQTIYFDGQAFTSGLSYAITNLIADNDATVVTASDVELTILYR